MSKQTKNHPSISPEQRLELLTVLSTRFEGNTVRHKSIKWADVEARLVESPEKLRSLNEMERTGGEPDVVGFDKKTGEYIFFDCSEESPKGRRSLCYDRAAWESRKQHKPERSSEDLAIEMGAELLSETDYHDLQTLGEFDLKTSSWLSTPPDIRKNGGAIFGDRRFGRVFIYHNGAESYYGARGFRCKLRV